MFLDSDSSHLNEVEQLKMLEEEQEQLNSSLLALTTHFAQVQFRLKQIVSAPADEKEVRAGYLSAHCMHDYCDIL